MYSTARSQPKLAPAVEQDEPIDEEDENDLPADSPPPSDSEASTPPDSDEETPPDSDIEGEDGTVLSTPPDTVFTDDLPSDFDDGNQPSFLFLTTTTITFVPYFASLSFHLDCYSPHSHIHIHTLYHTEDMLSLPSMDSTTMKKFSANEDDDDLLPDDISSDSEFDSYILG